MSGHAEMDKDRYHALDSVRGVAMLLGVVFHALMFRMFAGDAPPGLPGMGMGGTGASRYFQDWLHSFRMPLFFLISGFFARMMFKKYGLKRYLLKRWQRLGVCLVVSMFTFVPIYVFTRDAVSSGPPGLPPMGPPGAAAGATPITSPGSEDLPKPPAGFVPSGGVRQGRRRLIQRRRMERGQCRDS